MTLTCCLSIVRASLPAEQTGRLDREDQDHRRVTREIRDFRKQRLAEIVGEADGERADGGAAEAAHAADDDDGKGQRQHLEIEAGIDAEKGAADDAAERGEEGAEREDEHRDAVGVDADAARHLRVVDGGAHRRAHAGLFHRQPQRDADGDRHADHEDAVQREVNAADHDAGAELGTSVVVGGVYFPLYRVFMIGMAIAIGIALWLAMEKTRMGAAVRATVDDAQMARGVGIDTNRISMFIFALGAFLAALGGVIGGAFLGIYPGLDFEMLPLAFAVVIIGGMGSLGGAAIGALAVGLADNFGKALFPEVSYFTRYAPMVLILAVKPTGLFGRE